HELKTPLTTLSVSTQILKRNDIRADDTVCNEVIDTISRQNMRLQNLVDQVLSSSVGYEEIELRKEKITIQNFLGEIVADFRRNTHIANIRTDFDSDDATLSVDRFYLTTAIV